MAIRQHRPPRAIDDKHAKIAITLPRRLLEAARADAEAKHARSLSAYIARAIEDGLEKDELQQVLDEIFADQPMTDEEREWADRYLLDR